MRLSSVAWNDGSVIECTGAPEYNVKLAARFQASLPPAAARGRSRLGSEPLSLRASISEMRSRYPRAEAWPQSTSRAGYSPELRQTLVDQDSSWLVPAWFFDPPSTNEQAPGFKSIITDLSSLDFLEMRVPQPYEDSHDPARGDGQRHRPSAEGLQCA